jgi:hypothetical protein
MAHAVGSSDSSSHVDGFLKVTIITSEQLRPFYMALTS